MVPRRILPERVLGNRLTMVATLKEATGPILGRTLCTSSSAYPGYYETADAGFKDADGYLWIMSRTDDIISVAGHR
jgi:acyl-coenzyme A synthetase/AMP-(fatty) acid ligase